jgi:AraC-like DNA-binding protein
MLMAAPHLLNAEHQHTLIQVTFSLDGLPFEVWTEKDGWVTTQAVVINSNIPHCLKNFKGWQLTTCVMPDARYGKRLEKAILKGAPVIYPSVAVFRDIQEMLQSLKEQSLPDEVAFEKLTGGIYNSLIGNAELQKPIDERIRKIITYIRAHLSDDLSASGLAARVHLSEDRFMHLFKEQIGAPLRSYILWQRMAAAFEIFLEGKSLKEAAYEAGFSDPAHFTRTFVQNNGVPPSAYIPLKEYYRFKFFHC